jgi:hypothetical protein
MAPWCDSLAVTYPDAQFFKIDGELDDIGLSMDIKTFPSFYFYKNGSLIGTVEGTDKKKVRAMVVEHKDSPSTTTEASQTTIVA